jgi:8-oxo-dGTP diphosphatase
MVFISEVGETGFKIWTQVRDEEGPLFGKLEFPGGKIEPLETPKEAAYREVHEEVGIDVRNHEHCIHFKIQDYIFNNKHIVLYVFLSDYDQLPKEKGDWLEINYLTKSTHLVGKIPEINHVIIDELTVYIENLYRDNLLDLLWITSNQ